MSYTDAKREGYYQGYQHGLKGAAFEPSPKTPAIRTDRMSLHIFLEAYGQGYDRARSDRALMLKGREDSQQVQSRERDAHEPERGR